MSEPDADTLPTPVVLTRPSPPKRRGPRVVIGLVIAVVLLAIVAVAGEGAFRAYATAQVEQSIAKSLPAGVSGTVHAKLGGFSTLLQWLHGSFDDVTLTAPDLRLNGEPASARLHLTGLPTSGSGVIEHGVGTLRLSQAAIRSLEPLKAADVGQPTIGDGSVSTSVKRTVLGVPLTVDVTLEPSLSGKTIHLKATDAKLQSGIISVPGTALVQALLPNGISVCSAEYLPPGLTLSGLKATTGELRLDFTAERLDLAALEQGQTGSC